MLLVVDAVGIFNDHDGVVHHNAQAEQEGEEHDEIEGKANGRQDHEGDEHRKRHGGSDKQGIGAPHEEHQDEGHQDETDDDGVDEVVQGHPGRTALIAGNRYVEIGWKFRFLHLRRDLLDLVGSTDQVFARALDDVERDHVFAVQAAVAFLLFMAHSYVGDVLQIQHGSGLGSDDDVPDLLHILEIAADGDRAGHAADVHVAGRHGHVLAGNGVLNIPESEAGGGHFVLVHVHLHLFLQGADQVHASDLAHFLDAVFQLIGVVLQLIQAEITGDVDVHDRDFRNIELRHRGIGEQVVGQVALRLVHRVFHLLFGLRHIEAGIELDDNAGKILDGRRGHFFDAVDTLQLLFNGFGDQLLHIGRRGAGINGGDNDRRHHHVRKLLLGQCVIRYNAGQGDDHRDDENGRTVVNGPTGGFKLFHGD